MLEFNDFIEKRDYSTRWICYSEKLEFKIFVGDPFVCFFYSPDKGNSEAKKLVYIMKSNDDLRLTTKVTKEEMVVALQGFFAIEEFLLTAGPADLVDLCLKKP